MHHHKYDSAFFISKIINQKQEDIKESHQINDATQFFKSRYLIQYPAIVGFCVLLTLRKGKPLHRLL